MIEYPVISIASTETLNSSNQIGVFVRHDPVNVYMSVISEDFKAEQPGRNKYLILSTVFEEF